MGWRVGSAMLLAALLAGCAENRLLAGLQSQPNFALATPEPAMQPAPPAESVVATSAQASSPPAAATPPAGKFGVQIAARRSEAEGRALIDEMRAKFPGLLGQKWAMLYRVALPQGVFYRVVVGPLGSALEATQLCDSLKAQGAACIIRET